MQDIHALLDEIGLSPGEQAVYLSLIELGQTTSGPLSKHSGVSASKIYQVVDRLKRKGLIGEAAVAGTKHFTPAPPQALLDYLRQRQAGLKALETTTKAALPRLEEKYKATQKETEVQLLEGVKSMRNVLHGMLNELTEGDEYHVTGANVGEVPQKWAVPLFTNFHKERIRRKIRTKLLFQSEARLVHKNWKYAKIKYLPPEFKNPVQIVTYKDTTIMYLIEETPLIFKIKNADITKSFEQHFTSLWNEEIRVAQGFEAFQDAWNTSFDKLKRGESYNVFGAAFGGGEAQKQFVQFFETLHKKRIARGVKGKILFQQGAENVIDTFKLAELYSKDLEFKVLPFHRKFPVEIYPQGDTTLLLIQKKEPVTITIKNKEVTESFMQFFETMWQQDVQTFRGDNAITTIVDEVVATKKDLYLIGAHGYITQRYPQEFKKLVNGIKNNKKQRFHLSRESTRKSEFNKGAITSYLPEQFLGPMVIWIYGDYVAHALWEDELTIFRVKNKKVADDYRTYFTFLRDFAQQQK